MDTPATYYTETAHTSLYLFVFSPSRQERCYQLQSEKLSERSHTLSEHHVTIAEVFEHDRGHIGDEELTPYNSESLRRQYHIGPGQFKVVLAADSGVKMMTDSCVSCEEVIMRVENEPIAPRHSA